MNKNAVITGASRGIGAALALELAIAGYNLLLCGNSSPDSLEETAQQCEKKNVSCTCYIGDISLSKSAGEIADFAKNLWGHVDVLINNAGISHVGLATDVTDDIWFQLINTNLSSSFFMCREILPMMIHQKQGRIINISSIWGNIGASCEVAYSATKGGLNTLTKALAKEVAPSGVSVNAIACGMIDTSMNACFSQEDILSICDEIPIGRMASPKEVASLVTLLLQAPNYLTGQVIGFDGGWQ